MLPLRVQGGGRKFMKPEQNHSEAEKEIVSPFPAEKSLAHTALINLVGGVCHFPRLVLALALVLAGLSVYAFNTRLHYQTGRSDLISPTKDYQQRWRQY